MKDAIDKTQISLSEKVINAVDLAKIHPYSTRANTRTGYFCPVCHEPVQFIYSNVMEPYFKHLRDSPKAKACDRFTSAPGSLSQGRKYSSTLFAGNPLYIKQVGNAFEFYMGLPSLNQKCLEADRNIEVTVLNQDNAKFFSFIVSNRCKPEEMTYLQLRTVLGCFNLSYSNTPQLLTQRWKEKTYGLLDEGGIFQPGSTYCKKIVADEDIYCDTEYYLVLSEDVNVEEKDFLRFVDTESHPLRVMKKDGFDEWLVHKVVFMELSQEAWDFAQDLGVNLRSKKNTLVPLWPPHIINGQQRIYRENYSISHYLLNATKKECKCSLYFGTNQIIPESDECDAGLLLDIPIEKNQIRLSVDGEKNSQNPMILRDNKQYTYNSTEPNIELKYGKNKIEVGISDIYWINTADLTYHSDTKCDIMIQHTDGILSLYKNKTDLTLDHTQIKLGSQIIFIHGTESVRRIFFTRKRKLDSQMLLSEEYVIEQLENATGLRTVQPPAALRYILLRTKSSPRINKYIKHCLLTNSIPVKKCQVLLSIYDNIGEIENE